MATPIPGRDTLYYDAQCPLCSREVRLLRRLADGGLAFQDIQHYRPDQGQPTPDTLLRTLHLHDASGRWHTGVDATVQAWSHTRWGWLLKPMRWPLLATVADQLYSVWARRRYQRLYPCTQCFVAAEK